MTSDEIMQWLKEQCDLYMWQDDRYITIACLIDDLQNEMDKRLVSYFTSPSLSEQK